MSDATSDFSDIPTAYPPATGFDSVYIGEVLTLSRNAVEPLEAVPLQQVEEIIGPAGPYLPLIGGTVIGVTDFILNPSYSFINTPPFELAVIRAQIGPNSAQDIATLAHGASFVGYFDGISSAITVPAGAVPSGTQAIAGFVYSLDTQTGPGQTGSDGTALYGLAISGASQVPVYGGNIVVTDSITQAANGLTGQVLNGLEFDVNLYNTNTAAQAVSIHLNTHAAPHSGSYGYSIATAAGFFPLTYGFGSFQGAAVNALYVGPTTFAPTTPTPSQAIQFGYVDNTGTPTFHNVSISVQPTTTGGNLTFAGAGSSFGISAFGAFICNNVSEINAAFHAPYLAGGNNVTSFNSGSSPAVNVLVGGALQTTPGSLTNGLFSQRIVLNYTETGSATLQNITASVAPTATGGTWQFTGTGDANMNIKTGLSVGAPTGGMGAVGTITTQGAGTFNGGFGVFTTTTPVTSKPAVIGAKLASDVVMASLLTALVAYGFVTDSTT